MPNAQAVEALSNALADILNSSLPTPNPSLPQETQQEMASAMEEIRQRNISMGAEIAGAINTFVKKSTVQTKVDWDIIRMLLNGKFRPIVKIRLEDIVWCQNNPGVAKLLSHEASVSVTSDNVQTVYLNTKNAIY